MVGVCLYGAGYLACRALPFIMFGSIVLAFEPRHEKTNILHMRKKKDADPDQRLCFRYIDSTIALLSKSEISSL